MIDLSRRKFFGHSAALASLVAAGIPNLSFAQAATDKRLVVIVLRGAMDGLHMMPAYGDRHYYRSRPKIAVPKPGEQGGALDLNGYFGLHPKLGKLLPLYKAGDMAIIPAIATGYRERSHFDGQTVLESGTTNMAGTLSGWLNRALSNETTGHGPKGLALGKNVPLLLRGPSDVMSWAQDNLPDLEEEFLNDMAKLFVKDPLFSENLERGRSKTFDAPKNMMTSGKSLRSLNNFLEGTQAAGMILAQDKSPRIAVVDMLGFDTHYGQIPRMDVLFDALADGIMMLRKKLSKHWDKTTILVISEFGRTVAENGSQGTDHGRGGMSMLLGGTVGGGRVAGDWPGLSEKGLHEGRELKAAITYEALFKSVLISHLGLPRNFVEDVVFPQSRATKPIEGLFKT